jgi:signal transduction histidine kinase
MLFNQIKSSGNFPQPKNVSLVWQVANGLPSLMTDAEKLQVILENLISNALKFTDRGQVEVSAKSANMHEQCMVEFKVSDTGIGIADESLPVVFDLFRQVDSSTTRPYEDVGLGLYIARKYCELLGGEIAVDSKLGQGSTFAVRIPVRPST